MAATITIDRTAFGSQAAASDRGITYGETDELGFNVVRDPVHVHDLNATILHLLGLRPHAVDLPLPRPRFPPDRRPWAGGQRYSRLEST